MGHHTVVPVAEDIVVILILGVPPVRRFEGSSGPRLLLAASLTLLVMAEVAVAEEAFSLI